MKLHTFVSATALAAAMLVAGPASAQSFMINDQEIPVEQVDNFKEACEGMRAAKNASLTTSEDQIEEPIDPTQTGSLTADPAVSTSSPDPASRDKWDELLATLTIEECEAGGF